MLSQITFDETSSSYGVNASFGTGFVCGCISFCDFDNDGSNNYNIPTNAGFMNDTEESYSNAIGDINNDGYPDIIVNNEAANMFLWENNCDNNINNNWLKV
ncbi:FG-GAP repeat protein [Psychroserpens jangbogonensis]|uniref:FG-GAP repeat protein n=1 Tax=Psychroserpens jangbogonensis TaxID=1484460 RepID=UPI00053E7BF1|nr:FG-GAP repeat protein [Psychroserpens jangbogonensis]